MTITSIKKAKFGKQDFLFDIEGVFQTVSVIKSDGNTRSVNKINAFHIPTTTTTRAKQSADATVTTTVNVDASLQELYDDVFSIGVPDNVTLENSSGSLQIKDGGVITVKLADLNVTQAKMAANSVDSDQYVDGSIDAIHLNQTSTTEAVVTAAIRDLNVTTVKLANDVIDSTKIADDAVLGVNLDMDGSGTSFAQFIVLGGKHTITGGGTTETESASGAVAATDIVIPFPLSITNAATLKSAEIDADDQVLYTFTAAPGATTIQFIILRAVST